MKFYENQVDQDRLSEVLCLRYTQCVNEIDPEWTLGEWKYVVEEADGWLLHKAVCIDEVGAKHEKVFAQACSIPGYGWLYDMDEITEEDIIKDCDENILKCDLCGKEFPSTTMWEVEGLNLCDECYKDKVATCDSCGKEILIENAEFVDIYEDGQIAYSQYLCKDCF